MFVQGVLGFFLYVYSRSLGPVFFNASSGYSSLFFWINCSGIFFTDSFVFFLFCFALFFFKTMFIFSWLLLWFCLFGIIFRFVPDFILPCLKLLLFVCSELVFLWFTALFLLPVLGLFFWIVPSLFSMVVWTCFFG